MKGRHYTQSDVLTLGKRVNNSKRSYLLINPLQAKHIPVSPTSALEMMRHLGRLVQKSNTGRSLVIGFAETATAIATAVSLELSPACRYIQTTREKLEEVHDWILFSEEHSHATEQKLCGDCLGEWITEADHIIIVDDEFSTGKTLINIARALKAYAPEAEKKDFVAASIVNRVNAEHLRMLTNEGYRFVYLVKPEEEDYEKMVLDYQVREAEKVPFTGEDSNPAITIQLQAPYLNPRTGVSSQKYGEGCALLSEEACRRVLPMLTGSRILILGTEECMYPALTVGKRLEELCGERAVRCHATTRSPIGISELEDYPVQNGCSLCSFYDPNRATYLYNLQEYDMAVVVTDAGKDIRRKGLRDLQEALHRYGCERIICLGIGE